MLTKTSVNQENKIGKKESSIKGHYAICLVNDASSLSKSSNNEEDKGLAYIGMVYAVQANAKNEVLLASASVESEACLLFAADAVMAGRCTARVTWDPGGGL